MTDRFPRAFDLLKVHEGGFSDHPRDPGGATMKGVTQRTYDAYRFRQKQPPRHVRKITNAEVERIYHTQYWHAVHADDLPPGVAYCVFDAAVNSGPGRAVRWLQTVIGAQVDGIVGNETVSQTRDVPPDELIHRYCDKRLSFMKSLRHWSTFKNGWSRRVHEVRAQSIEWAYNETVATDTAEPPTAKADGKKSVMFTIKDAASNRGVQTVAGGLLSSGGVLSSSEGPIPYAVAAVLVIAALAGLWWIVRGRET